MTAEQTTEKPIYLTEGVPPRGLERVRLAIPDAAVPALVKARAKRRLRRPEVLEQARTEMTWLLDAVRTPEEIEAIAQRYVEQDT